MNEIQLGQIIEDEQTRDAIHIAIAPVMAIAKLYPGQDVGFIKGRPYTVGISENPIGIVDPFLKGPVFEDQSFWMFLYPNTIADMRYHWSHPAFSEAEPKPSKESAEEWLKQFASKTGLSYSRMMQIVKEFVDSGEVWTEQGTERARDAWYALKDNNIFWQNFEAVTLGTRVE